MSRRTADISTSWRTSEAGIFEVRACTRMATLITRSPMRSRSVVDFRLESKLAGARLVHAGNGCGQPLIDLAFDQVELLLAIFDREKRHARRICEQVADIKRGVAGDQAGFQREVCEIVGAACFGRSAPRPICWTSLD